jgi:hypothetical protein
MQLRTHHFAARSERSRVSGEVEEQSHSSESALRLRFATLRVNGNGINKVTKRGV